MDFSENEIKSLFLEHELFSQFKSNVDKLSIEILEPGHFRLHLDNFPGLNTKPLNGYAFSTLQLEGINLSGGYVTSGGIEGVVVQYQYEIPKNEIKMSLSDIDNKIQSIRNSDNSENLKNSNKPK